MRRFAIAIAALGLVLLGNMAESRAQAYPNYPFCAIYGNWTWVCSFNTWDQCMMTISGRGGMCSANPDYKAAPRARRKG